VRIPSRGGIDPYDPVLDCMASWLDAHGLECRRLAGLRGMTVALACEVSGAATGPRYVLDACLDTAPFGDESAWKHPPTSGVATDGWLHGRGSSDSKADAAIFAHILARLKSAADRWAGSVVLLRGIPATAGFGVVYEGLHGTDERIRIDSIPAVQAAYHQALLTLLAPV
jgi:succinyl-diaminopimelate desuccinylase